MNKYIMSSIIGLSFVLGSFLLSDSMKYFKDYERIVRVKGLSERKMKSTLGVWKLTIETFSNERKFQYELLRKQKKIIEKYLIDKGFKLTELDIGNIKITDRYSAYEYAQKVKKLGGDKVQKLKGQVHVSINSTNVDLIKNVSTKVDELIGQGIQIPQSETYFKFTRINEIKEEMLKEATKNAKKAAQSFAENSGTKVGAIQTANQGYFEIKDTGTTQDWVKNRSMYKLVRVVTNVSYFLD